MAKKWNVQLHAVVVMSNHWHLCLTDPDGNIVNFQRDCHAFIARAVNAAHGEFESVWSGSQTSRVECIDRDSMIRQMAYTMANPVEAGLVREGKSWPGVRHAWPCRAKLVSRPTPFFHGPRWPESIELQFSPPPGFDDISEEALADRIRQAIDARETQIRTKYHQASRMFLGRRAVLRQRRHGHPRTNERRFRLSPRLACQDKWKRVERLCLDKEWSAAYTSSLRAWRAGQKHVSFPAGTYKMRVAFGCVCEEQPT